MKESVLNEKKLAIVHMRMYICCVSIVVVFRCLLSCSIVYYGLFKVDSYVAYDTKPWQLAHPLRFISLR